jgi:hypothetical protein
VIDTGHKAGLVPGVSYPRPLPCWLPPEEHDTTKLSRRDKAQSVRCEARNAPRTLRCRSRANK